MFTNIPTLTHVFTNIPPSPLSVCLSQPHTHTHTHTQTHTQTHTDTHTDTHTKVILLSYIPQNIDQARIPPLFTGYEPKLASPEPSARQELIPTAFTSHLKNQTPFAGFHHVLDENHYCQQTYTACPRDIMLLTAVLLVTDVIKLLTDYTHELKWFWRHACSVYGFVLHFHVMVVCLLVGVLSIWVVWYVVLLFFFFSLFFFSSLVYFVIIIVMNMIVLMSPSDGPAHCRMNTVLLNWITTNQYIIACSRQAVLTEIQLEMNNFLTT